MDQNNSFTELEKNVELLMNTFNNILFLTPDELVVTPTRNNLREIGSCLDKIFPENKCFDVLYTPNYDKLFFGIRVNPTISPADLIQIIGDEEKMKLNSYKLEFDSKLFDMGLSPQELAAYTIYEVGSMCASYQIIDDLRTVIDLNMTSNDDTVYLKESVNYAQLVIYAIKDSLTKLSSLIYKDSIEEYVTNPVIQGCDLGEFLVSAHDTIIASENGPKDSLRASNTSILQWMFIMYRDMRTNSSTVMDTLRDAKTTTGSKLDIEEINKTIDSINRIDATIEPQTEALELPKFFEAKNMSSVNEFTLFAGLKKNGLRSIEDYLYEAAIRMKNLETEDEAMFLMRSLNTRMNILIDYIYNTPGLSDREKEHWEQVYDRYAKLREELVKKRIWNKKQYGLFFDYNQDFGDKPYEESADQPMDTKDNMTEYTKDQYEKLAGDSSKWNKITQPDLDISEKDIEAELESISFDDNGNPVITESEVSTDPKGEVIDDEKESNFQAIQRDNQSVDAKIDDHHDTADVVVAPDSVDITISDDINESVLFGDESEFQYELEENEACCEKCGSSNVTVGEGGNCTCKECGNTFVISHEIFGIKKKKPNNPAMNLINKDLEDVKAAQKQREEAANKLKELNGKLKAANESDEIDLDADLFDESVLNEFKSDIKQANDARLAAEKQSHLHDGNAKDRMAHAKGDMSYGKGHHHTEYEMDDNLDMKAKQVPNHDQLKKADIEKATTKKNILGQKTFKATGEKVTKADEDNMQKAEDLNKTVRNKVDYDARQKAMKEVASSDLSEGLPSFL